MIFVVPASTAARRTSAAAACSAYLSRLLRMMPSTIDRPETGPEHSSFSTAQPEMKERYDRERVVGGRHAEQEVKEDEKTYMARRSGAAVTGTGGAACRSLTDSSPVGSRDGVNKLAEA